MNETQIKWVNGHIQKMKEFIESKGEENLIDDDWDKIVDYMEKCIAQSKSMANEVRKMFFDFIEPYDRRARDAKKKNINSRTL